MDLHGFGGGGIGGSGGIGGGSDNKNRYVCPSDRQLALRAKLQTGWSSVKPAGPLDPEEKNAIIEVIRRNEQLESAERQRVGKLVERVEKIKQRAAECGPRFCRLCGQSFGLLGPSKQICEDCRKPVCSKCSIELQTKCAAKEIWLCKICAETREMWKKTGAWFYKGIPKYEIPQRSSSMRNTLRGESRGSNGVGGVGISGGGAGNTSGRVEKNTKLGIKSADSSSEEDEDDRSNECCVDSGRSGSVNTGLIRPDRWLHRLASVNKKHPLSNQQSNTANHSHQHSQLPHQQQQQPMQQNMMQSSNVDWETVSISGSITTTATNRNGLAPRRGSVSSSWSISETSSANSSNNGGLGSNYKEPPLGWLELSLQYSEADHTLDCFLVRARDLPPMDSTGLADPFCKINIITEYGTVKQKKWVSTKTVHKTINPEFNESIRFLGVEPDEMLANCTQLYIVLLDDDFYGHDFLGAAKINLHQIYNADSRRISVPLDMEDKHCLDAAATGPWTNGQILISLCYNTKRRALVVQIRRCTNLMAKDNNGFSDPFVKIHLKPDSHRNKKYKTSVKWRNLNPIFNEEFSFETRPNELDKQSLILTVWDKDLGKSNDFLGSLTLGSNSKGRRLKQWKDCIRLPDCTHEQWHYLSSEQNHSR